MPIGSSQNITLPTQGGNTGTWGTDLNTELQKLINSVEAQVPVSAINFNALIDINSQAVDDIDYFRFRPTGSAGNGARSLYMSAAGELFFVDGVGVSVQITSNGTLNFGSVGGIGNSGGTYGTLGIEIDWNGTQYDMHDGASNYAPVRLSTVLFENSGFFITMTAPALSASYTATLPAAPPAESRPLVMSPTGAVTAATEIDVEGDVYHGTQTYIVPMIVQSLGADWTFNVNGTANPTLTFNGGGTGQFTVIAVPFRVDDRVIGLTADLTGLTGTAQVMRMELFRGNTQIGADANSSGNGNQTISIGATTQRIASTDSALWIVFTHTSTGAMTATINRIILTTDRTKP